MVDSDGNLNVNRDIAIHLTQLILKDSIEKFRAAPDREATLKEAEDYYGNPNLPQWEIRHGAGRHVHHEAFP